MGLKCLDCLVKDDLFSETITYHKHLCFECGDIETNDAVKQVYCTKCSEKLKRCKYCGTKDTELLVPSDMTYPQAMKKLEELKR